MEEAAVTLNGEMQKFNSVEEGRWYVAVEDGEMKHRPFKIEELNKTLNSTPLGNAYEAYKAEGVTTDGIKTVYEIRGGSAKKFGDDGRRNLRLVPYHGMNLWEEVSQEDELLDADEILGNDEEVVLPADKVRKSLQGETDRGKKITTDAQPSRKEVNKYVDYHVSPLFRSRFS